MNFTPFGNPFPGSIPGIAQFSTSTAQLVSTVTSVPATVTSANTLQQQQQQQQQQQDVAGPSNRYQQQQQQQLQQQAGTTSVTMAHFNQPTLPVAAATTLTTIPPKFRTNNDDPQGDKYNGHMVTLQAADTGGQQSQQPQYAALPAYNPQTEDKRLIQAAIAYPQSTVTASTSSAAAASVLNLQQAQLQPSTSSTQQMQAQLAPQELTQDLCNAILQQQGVDSKRVLQNTSWQSLTPGTTVADYLSHLPANTLPLSLHHFLKYSAENIKKETPNLVQTGPNLGINTIGTTTTITIPQHQLQQITTQLQEQQQHQQQQQQQVTGSAIQETLNTVQLETGASTSALAGGQQSATTTAVETTTKRKKRRRRVKQHKPKPKPGEIRLTTALDGSCLYLCPECQVAYPELELLEIHLIGHNAERRFVCDICQAVLKRKDHLTRHKQSHNPERPFICTVCLKAFKRKEQLSLHFVIHSGEKKHICQDCGKRFYRKDHLRKHTRSHIARRVKAELCLQKDSEAGPSTSTAANSGATSERLLVPDPGVIAAVHATLQQQQQQQNTDQQHQIHTQQLPQQHHTTVVTQQQQTSQHQPQHTQILN